MTATVATLRRLYHERTGRAFPGGDGVVAMLAQHYGGWREPAGEVVTAMVQWVAANASETDCPDFSRPTRTVR